MSLESWLSAVWYENHPSGVVLRPLSWVFGCVINFRKRWYESGRLSRCRFDVPVVVIGNITVGGTGKTPLVECVARRAQALGLQPGIICRGYRGQSKSWPQLVTADSDPKEVGDEAVLLARLTEAPVVAGPDRCAAIQKLLEQNVDIVLCDDGLQHYRLERDAEIAVIDSERRLGNGRLLPSGPLREPAVRLANVDLVIVNGDATTDHGLTMQLVPQRVFNLISGETTGLSRFSGKGVHAVAGIGNPDRFFKFLQQHDIEVTPHPMADHAALKVVDFEFDDDLPVLMTAKDAVKAAAFATDAMWVVEVRAEPDLQAIESIDQLLRKLCSQP